MFRDDGQQGQGRDPGASFPFGPRRAHGGRGGPFHAPRPGAALRAVRGDPGGVGGRPCDGRRSRRAALPAGEAPPPRRGWRPGRGTGGTPVSLEPKRRQELREQFVAYAHDRDPGLREQLVAAHLGLAEYLARRFANRGEALDDLVQVASLGLIKAVDRFDPERGVEFSTYATHTIVGELKRHFRDKGWAIRAPRRMQELYLRLGKVVATLGQELGRSPTIPELAAEVKVSEEEVLEALEAGQAYRSASLDAPTGNEEGETLATRIGEDDPSLEGAESRATLSPLLAQLPPRERLILHLRFFQGLTQSEIATSLGISQMHVSRLLARSLAQLRSAADAPAH
ncbi:MAG: SigB/SigF/SigG family RNA polymerase sigma factor [Acidimicrobiales bacterium]